MHWDVEMMDEVVRVGRMRGRGRHTVLFVPGRGDSLELREAVGRRLAHHAGSVVMVELRGQGGSGRLGRHPDAVHIDDFEHHLHDIDNAIDGLSGDIHLVAHSMGGLLAAHLLARRPERFASAAISSPMWRFTQSLAVVRPLASAARFVGRRTSFAAGEGPFDMATCVEMRTGRPGPTPDGALEHFVEHHPEMVRGGSTWGWVAAAARSMSALDAAALERYDGPVIVGSCQADRTVSLDAHQRITNRFPRGRVIDLDGGHDPFTSDGAVRWWSAIEATLQGDPDWSC
jgi:lysophospholipase